MLPDHVPINEMTTVSVPCIKNSEKYKFAVRDLEIEADIEHISKAKGRIQKVVSPSNREGGRGTLKSIIKREIL